MIHRLWQIVRKRITLPLRRVKTRPDRGRPVALTLADLLSEGLIDRESTSIAFVAHHEGWLGRTSVMGLSSGRRLMVCAVTPQMHPLGDVMAIEPRDVTRWRAGRFHNPLLHPVMRSPLVRFEAGGRKFKVRILGAGERSGRFGSLEQLEGRRALIEWLETSVAPGE